MDPHPKLTLSLSLPPAAYAAAACAPPTAAARYAAIAHRLTAPLHVQLAGEEGAELAGEVPCSTFFILVFSKFRAFNSTFHLYSLRLLVQSVWAQLAAPAGGGSNPHQGGFPLPVEKKNPRCALDDLGCVVSLGPAR